MKGRQQILENVRHWPKADIEIRVEPLPTYLGSLRPIAVPCVVCLA